MEKAYRETKTNLLQINDLLSKLDRAFDYGEIDATKLEISKKLSEITGSFDQLDLYVVKEPVTKRYDAKMRVDQLKYDFTHYRTAFNTIVQRKYVFYHHTYIDILIIFEYEIFNC
jgi:Golgi SNAP receptor complex protein 2